MKNKNKSAKVQKYVAQVNDQAKMAGKNKEAVCTWMAIRKSPDH
jgi:hypothetical protein